MAWKLYTDSACTTPFGGTLSFVHKSDFSDNPQDRVLYYADVELDPVDNGSYQMKMSAGGNINITIQDTTSSSGHETSEIKLATTSAGLDTAVAGASLSLGTSLTSGVSGRKEIHIRVTNAVTTPGISTELSLQKPETVIVATGA
jgi:hypothetical protein